MKKVAKKLKKDYFVVYIGGTEAEEIIVTTFAKEKKMLKEYFFVSDTLDNERDNVRVREENKDFCRFLSEYMRYELSETEGGAWIQLRSGCRIVNAAY